MWFVQRWLVIHQDSSFAGLLAPEPFKWLMQVPNLLPWKPELSAHVYSSCVAWSCDWIECWGYTTMWRPSEPTLSRWHWSFTTPNSDKSSWKQSDGETFLDLEMCSNVHCSSRGDLHYLVGYCSCLPRIPPLCCLERWSEFPCFGGEHWNSWLGSDVAVPHRTDCAHSLRSTFFVPQLGGRLGDAKLYGSWRGLQLRYLEIRHSIPTVDWTSLLLMVREFLLLFEFVGLQFLIQNRLQSLWPALFLPGCKVWLARCLRMEVAIVFLGAFNIFLVMHFPMSSGSIIRLWVEFANNLFTYGVPTCFFIWSVLVTVTLLRVVLMFQKALELARKQGLAVAATFQECRGRSILQCAGVIISLTTSVSLYFSWGLQPALQDTVVPHCVNLLVNAAGIILLSGASSLITTQGTLRFPPVGCCRCPCRFGRCCGFKSLRRSKLKVCEENDWEKKTRELANRGVSLEELLAFYKNLGDTVMQSFQPSVHTTADVVRLAIIPLTASSCSSYAQLVNKGAKVLPKKMVTHNWSNLFRDLLASAISDSLGEHTFEFVAELLSDKAGVEALEDMLRVHGSLQETYWICAFAVNQHAGICGENPSGTVDPVTGLTHPTCQCSEPKFFNEDPPLNDDGKSIQCEMNKFDDMMALLARENPDFAEVVAVDASLDLFGRAWCVAELAEAHRMGMAQRLKMRNAETLLRRQLTLQGLKVEQMKASRPEDVVEILAKIPDKEAFNAKLQEMIFDSNVGLVAAWRMQMPCSKWRRCLIYSNGWDSLRLWRVAT